MARRIRNENSFRSKVIHLRGKTVAVDVAAFILPITTHKKAYLSQYITPAEPATYVCETLEERLIKPLLGAEVRTIILVFDGVRPFEPKELTRYRRRERKREALKELSNFRIVSKGSKQENRKLRDRLGELFKAAAIITNNRIYQENRLRFLIL